MKLESLKPGMTVYDVGRQKMGNTKLRTVVVWPVFIHEIDLERRTVLASWNGNRVRVFGEVRWKNWRLKVPVLIRGMMGSVRLATREEVAAMKAEPQRTPSKSQAKRIAIQKGETP